MLFNIPLIVSDMFFGKKILSFLRKAFGEELAYVSPSFPKPLNKEEVTYSFIGLDEIENDALLIVNDHYRATPSALIVRLMRELGLLPEKLSFLIATGTHKAPSKELLAQLTGKRAPDIVFVHNAKNNSSIIDVGTTSRGTPVTINKLIMEHSQILTINSVEPHYFAGFTGGVKSLVPGCAGYETVVQNHKWAMHEDSKIMKTIGNPVWEDLWEAGNMIIPLKEVQSIQLVNHGEILFSVNSGSLPNAFEKTMKEAQLFYGVKLDKEIDHVITIVQPPLDKNLYQAHKAIENTKNVVKDGGSLILVAENREGIGTDAFYKTLKLFESPKNVLKTLTIDNYHFGDHKAYKWAETVERIELLYMGDLSHDVVENVFMKKINENELVSLVREWVKNGESVVVDEMGGYTTLYT